MIANACKALAYEQSTLGAVIVTAAGLFYILLSLPILLIPGFAVKGRQSISLSLLLAIVFLLYTKFRITGAEEENFFLLASEAASGLTKRLLVVIALACDPETTALGRLIHPFTPSTKKTKKD